MTPRPLQFEILHQDKLTSARAARATTRHGSFDTPAFMPVGTQASVKGMLPEKIAAAGRKSSWPTPITSCSARRKSRRRSRRSSRHDGLARPHPHRQRRIPGLLPGRHQRIDDTGVTFKSHIDGSTIFLDAARSIAVQNDLGADIIMAFDQCPAADAPPRPIAPPSIAPCAGPSNAWPRTPAQTIRPSSASSRAASISPCVKRARRRLDRNELRRLRPRRPRRRRRVRRHGNQLSAQTDPHTPRRSTPLSHGRRLPARHRRRRRRGIDMFDCVLPTRNGRNAYAFTASGPLRLRNAQFHARYRAPSSPVAIAHACQRFSRGAIRHLFYAGEMLGPILVSVHNIRFYQRLMADIRRSIACGRFRLLAAMRTPAAA